MKCTLATHRVTLTCVSEKETLRLRTRHQEWDTENVTWVWEIEKWVPQLGRFSEKIWRMRWWSAWHIVDAASQILSHMHDGSTQNSAGLPPKVLMQISDVPHSHSSAA